MARGPRRLTGENPRRNTNPEHLRDTHTVLLPELRRVLDTGVKQSFLMKHAKMSKSQITEIVSGRKKKVTVRTHGDLLEVLIQIQDGTLPVPHEYRRYVPGRLSGRLAKDRDCCVREHPYTPENTYYTPKGTRTCRTCQAASRAEYRKRNPDSHAEAQRSAARRRYAAQKAEREQGEAA